AKNEKYGKRFLAAIKDHLNSEEEDFPKPKSKVSTQQVSYELYKKGLSVPEIGLQRNLKENTIYGHFQRMHEEGKPIDLLDFINKDEIALVQKAKKELRHDEESLKPIFEHLQEQVPYWKIRMGLYLGDQF